MRNLKQVHFDRNRLPDEPALLAPARRHGVPAVHRRRLRGAARRVRGGREARPARSLIRPGTRMRWWRGRGDARPRSSPARRPSRPSPAAVPGIRRPARAHRAASRAAGRALRLRREPRYTGASSGPTTTPGTLPRSSRCAPTAAIVATCPLRGVKVRDPEDIAVGPCDAGSTTSCIYLGDIGDNGSRRQSRPDPQGARADHARRSSADPRRSCRSATRAARVDAEALLVDPRTARVFVISKSLLSLGDVYRIDGLGSREGGIAVRMRTLRPPREFDAADHRRRRAPERHAPAAPHLHAGSGSCAARRRASFEDVLDADARRRPRGRAAAGRGASATPGTAAATSSAGEGAGSPIYRVRCAEPLISRSTSPALETQQRADHVAE